MRAFVDGLFIFWGLSFVPCPGSHPFPRRLRSGKLAKKLVWTPCGRHRVAPKDSLRTCFGIFEVGWEVEARFWHVFGPVGYGTFWLTKGVGTHHPPDRFFLRSVNVDAWGKPTCWVYGADFRLPNLLRCLLSVRSWGIGQYCRDRQWEEPLVDHTNMFKNLWTSTALDWKW